MKIDLKNKQTRTILIISGLALLVGIILYFSLRKKPANNIEIETDPTSSAPGINTNGTVNVEELSVLLFPLKRGSQNDYVRVLQSWLNSHGANLSTYGIDGKFGAETEAACESVLGVKEVSFEKFKSLFA